MHGNYGRLRWFDKGGSIMTDSKARSPAPKEPFDDCLLTIPLSDFGELARICKERGWSIKVRKEGFAHVKPTDRR